MKTRQESHRNKIIHQLMPAYRLADALLRLKRSRIVWRLMTLATLFILISVGGFIAYLQQPMLVDREKIPKRVRIEDQGQVKDWVTYQDKLIQAVDEAGVQVGEKDLLSLPADETLIPGKTYELTVIRRESFKLLWSGLAVEATSAPIESADLMSRSGYDAIDLSDGSRIEKPAEDTLSYIAVDKREFRIKEAIKYTTSYVNEPDLEIGKSVVKQEGQKGSRDIIYEDTYENGIFISRVKTGTEVTLQPVEEIIGKGTKVVIKPIDRKRVGATVLNSFDQIKPLLQPNGIKNYSSFSENGNGTLTIDGKTFSYSSVLRRRITMFDGLEVCVKRGDHNPPRNHNTASGIPAQRGLVATYGNRIDGKTYPTLPMGTIVFIENYGLGVVADIHGVSSNKDLLDACYDPGELMSGAFPVFSAYRNTYIIYVPQ